MVLSLFIARELLCPSGHMRRGWTVKNYQHSDDFACVLTAELVRPGSTNGLWHLSSIFRLQVKTQARLSLGLVMQAPIYKDLVAVVLSATEPNF